MAHIDDSLTAALYRITCPDSATLGNFHLELLAKDETVAIADHLAICPHCMQEVNQLEMFLAETAVLLEASTGDRIKIWIAKLIPSGGGAGSVLGTPAFAMRGNSTGPLMYEAGETQLTLEIQDDPEKPGHKSILGLVLGIESNDVEVNLIREGEVVTAVTLDDLGNFTFSGLESGKHELILSGQSIEIHVPDLII
ncbi:MAG: hypothetical protein GY805_20720 [Chloroflexi bacterium]|nr:hypothetical protein [Chloroflexota bacterium]